VRLLVGADVPPDPDAGAAGTVVQTNGALRALGHDVDEIWADHVGRRIRHGNLHYAFELPWRYRALVRQRTQAVPYDVVQLSQPHAYLAARDNRLHGRREIFVNRSHGVEFRADAAMDRWGGREGALRPGGSRRVLSRPLGRLLQSHWRWAARWSDGLIVPCELDRESVLERFPIVPWRVRTIHHGVPRAFVDVPVPELDQSRLMRLLYVAQFAPFKAPETVAAVANGVLPRYPGATLSWVAPASVHPRIRALLSSAVAGRVRFLDWRPQEHLRSLLDEHGIFLFPSYFEGAGKACLEALSRGLLVIASDNGAMRDYIRDGVNGWVFPPGDPAPYQRAVERCLNDLDGSREVGRRARETGRSYTWQRCAAEAVAFYEELKGRRETPLSAPNF
jgi:glycosyltransferase involved in cell wall biosynthesis